MFQNVDCRGLIQSVHCSPYPFACSGDTHAIDRGAEIRVDSVQPPAAATSARPPRQVHRRHRSLRKALPQVPDGFLAGSDLILNALRSEYTARSRTLRHVSPIHLIVLQLLVVYELLTIISPIRFYLNKQDVRGRFSL